MYSRRHFLKLSSAITGGVLVSSALSGCQHTAGHSRSSLRFAHGVASGDPLADGFILWTRATPESAGSSEVTLGWELAIDPGFGDVLRSGTATTSAARDYTVKIDVRELDSGRDYYYRFIGSAATSPVGRARTLPEAGVERVRLAIMSCSNYPAGYFHVYREASRLDGLDAFLHLGDYIYEYGGDGYATEDAVRLGRELAADNSGELYVLDDYRRRYAHYRRDADLQAMHAAAPCIAVWDDHEIANNTWRDGAENHQANEGDFNDRKLAAVQAYYEWLPIRPPAGEGSEQIYRSFSFGDLVDLHMLDTRLIGRDKQLAYADYRHSDSGEFDRKRFAAELGNPERSLLGDAQRGWLAERLVSSRARWQLLGQQILMARMLMPAEMFAAKSNTEVPNILRELTELKQRQLQGQALTEAEQQRLASVIPYNLDAWDGYPAERETLYATAMAANKRLISLAGDTHNGWFSKLVSHDGAEVGAELATSSVSSPGMETYLDMDSESAVAASRALALLVEDLQYCNLHQRGYLALDITPKALEARWVYVDTVKERDYRVSNEHIEVINA
jgi:alkaline phosphatase D